MLTDHQIVTLSLLKKNLQETDGVAGERRGSEDCVCLCVCVSGGCRGVRGARVERCTRCENDFCNMSSKQQPAGDLLELT